MEQLLIVEDDKGLSQGLCKALAAENRKVFSSFEPVSSIIFTDDQMVVRILHDAVPCIP